MLIGVEATSNRILRSLSSRDLNLVSPWLEQIPLAHNDPLHRSNVPIDYAHFIDTGLVSVLASTHAHRIEVGMIGFEGMTGFSLAMGVMASPNEFLVQTPGIAWRITATALSHALAESATLRAVLLRYVQSLIIQTTQTALANGVAKLEQRLARWILMWSDRLRSSDIPVTHDFLALLLGVHRPSATSALHLLEGKQLILAGRGRIHVRNRDGLVLVADGFYGVAEAEYNQLMQLGPHKP